MAYTKVSDLTALTSPDGAEELLVNDGGTSKKITITNATASKLPLAGGTLTGDLNLGDGVDINFGDSADLKIYHDGSHSYIKENGTGQLFIEGTELRLRTSAGANYFLADENGRTAMFYSGTETLATTSTGIDVTGNVVVSGTVDGVDIQTLNTTASAALPKAGGTMTGSITDLRVPDNAYIGCASDTTMIQFQGTGVTHIPGATTMGGDLAITQIVADSAAIDYLVDIAGNRTSNAVAGQGVGLRFKIPSWKDSAETYVGAGIGAVRESSSDSDVSTALTFSTSQNDATLDEFMRIDSTGNVGIGTSSPTSTQGYGHLLEISDGDSGTNKDSALVLSSWNGSSAENKWEIGNNTSGKLQFVHSVAGDGSTGTKMIIDASGNVGIGDTDPSEAKLSIDNVAAGDIGLQIVQAQDEYGLYIDQNGNSNALLIDSESTSSNTIRTLGKYGIRCDQDLSGGYAGSFYRNLAEVGSHPLVTISDDHASNTQPALKILQAGAGYGLHIDQNGNKIAIYIDSEATTEDGIAVQCDALTTGSAAHFYSNSATTDTRNLVEIWNDHASATGTTALYVQQDSTGAAAVFEGGNVGIGTTSPDHILSLSSTNPRFGMYTADGGNAGERNWMQKVNGTAYGSWELIVSNAKAGNPQTAGTTAITVLKDGNVGIGVTPESWDTDRYKWLALGSYGNIAAQQSGTDLYLTSNVWWNTSVGRWEYQRSTAGYAASLKISDQFIFKVSDGTNVRGEDFGADAVTAMTIANDGDVTVDTGNLVIGTAGKGIDFSAQTATSATGAAATSEVLDHYEEGTWTPTIKDATGNLATLSTANGSYTKIGRWVQINFQITLSSKESMTGNYVLMGGIPFNHPTQAYNGTGVIDTWTNFATSFSGLWFDTSSTGSLMWLSAVAGAGSTSYELPVVDDLNDNSHMKGSCMYQISV